MRCPKCSYISFDYLTSCGKCAHNLQEYIDQIKGTALKVGPTLFLASVTGQTVPGMEGGETLFAVPGAGMGSEEDLTLEPTEMAQLDLSGLDSVADLQADDLPDLSIDAASGMELAGEDAEAPVDLDEIDLSDLLPPMEEEAAAAPTMEATDEEDALIDLGSFVDEPPDQPAKKNPADNIPDLDLDLE